MKDLLAMEVGTPDAAQWPLDRGLQYGDGLFETMMVRDGRIRFLDLHQRRLAEGCQRLAIRVDAGRLWQQAVRFATGEPRAMLKLLVTRGAALARGYRPDGHEAPRCILYRFRQPAAAALPARAVRLSLQLGENPALAGMKHCNRLELVLAASELARHQATEGLLASTSGRLVSGTMSNVLVRHGGKWMTPELDRCGVAGVMRAVVMREAAAAGRAVEVAALPFAMLDDCEALCLANVRLGLLPVTELDGRSLASDNWALQLGAHIGTLND